jgi:hypothetical protein
MNAEVQYNISITFRMCSYNDLIKITQKIVVYMELPPTYCFSNEYWMKCNGPNCQNFTHSINDSTQVTIRSLW